MIVKQIKQSIRKVKKQISHIKKHPTSDVSFDFGFIGGLETCIDELETIKDTLNK